MRRARPEDIEAQCGWCEAVRIAGVWHPFDERLPISHGICPECVRKVFPQHADRILKEDDDASSLSPDENPLPYGLTGHEYHEHPMHGWIDPEGTFYWCKRHYPWASKHLGQLYRGDHEYWELINRGWWVVGPGDAMGKNAPNRKQFETIQALVLEHAGGTPYIRYPFTIETGHDVQHPCYTVYQATAADLVEASSWSSFSKRALRERSCEA